MSNTVLKGTAGSEITITQPAFLGVDPDGSGEWRAGSLGVDELAPLLFPGDKALLFLASEESAGYSVQIYTGHYLIDETNKISALPVNPFASTVTGKTLDEFVDMIEEALAQLASP